MNFFINFLVNGNVNSQTGEQASQGGSFLGSSGGLLIFFLIFILVLYFFSIRPQKKKEKKQKEKLAAISKGDKVQTIGGWRGTIAGIRENTFILKLEDGAKIEIVKNAIADVIIESNSSIKNNSNAQTKTVYSDTADVESESISLEESDSQSQTKEKNDSGDRQSLGNQADLAKQDSVENHKKSDVKSNKQVNSDSKVIEQVESKNE